MNKRHILQIGISLLSLTAFAAFAPVAQADKLDDIKKSGKMRVAILQDFPPFGSVGPDMKPLGLDVDLAHLLAEKLGVAVEFIPVGSPNRIPYLQTGKVDIIIASLGKNAEREKVVDFSAPYAMTYNGVFGPPEIQVSGPDDLSGKTLGVTRGSTQDLAITKMVPSSIVIKRFEDSTGTQAAYLSGQTDLFVTGNITAFFVAKDAKRPLEVKFKINDEGAYIGTAKGEAALMAQVNETIAELKKNGTLSALSKKWLNEDTPIDF